MKRASERERESKKVDQLDFKNHFKVARRANIEMCMQKGQEEEEEEDEDEGKRKKIALYYTWYKSAYMR